MILPIDAPKGYDNIFEEDVINLMKSGLPNEQVRAEMIMHPELKIMGWHITVSRPLYGEMHDHNSFVSLNLVRKGPEWVAEQHRIIDNAFEMTRRQHPKALN